MIVPPREEFGWPVKNIVGVLWLEFESCAF